MTTYNVDVLMPRFTTESETHLEGVLSSMGMPLAFHPRTAEFSNMVKDEELWISMMMQKAKIEVNEKGTKASAVTIARGIKKDLRATTAKRTRSSTPHAHLSITSSITAQARFISWAPIAVKKA